MQLLRRIVTVPVAAAVFASGLLFASPAWAAGNFALRFNGNSSPQTNVVATTSSPTLTKNFSVSADLRWDGTAGYSAAVSLPSIDTAVGTQTGVAFGLADGAPFLALKDTALANRVEVTSAVLAIGQWYSVTATYDGQVTSIFIDGMLSATQDFGSNTDLTSTNGTILIGREFSLSTDPGLNSRGFHGDIDNVEIASGLYPAALTPLATYSFSEGSGLSTADAGPSTFTGTLSSTMTPQWVQGSDAVALTYQSSATAATPVTTYLRPFTPFVYGSTATFSRAGYTLTGWTDVSTLTTVSTGDAGVMPLAPRTLEAVWAADPGSRLANTGIDQSAAWRILLLAVVLLGFGLGALLGARRRSRSLSALAVHR